MTSINRHQQLTFVDFPAVCGDGGGEKEAAGCG